MSEYKCRICGEEATHIAAIYYHFLRDICVSAEYLVCSDENCHDIIVREIVEGSRDKEVQIYPLNFDSLKLIPYREERERLREIILQCNLSRGLENRASTNLKQTKQDKSIAREPSQ